LLEPGINKPFDRIARELAEESPRLFLRILGIVPPGALVELEPLRPESAPPVVMPDYVATMRIDGGEPSVFHVEFFVRYRKGIPGTMARYGGSLALQYRRPVQSVALLLGSEGCPDELPAFGAHSIGETSITHAFHTVRLWELDPEPVLSEGGPGLLPWALLTRLGREDAWRVGAQVAATGEERLIARFLMLGSLRYDRSELEQMLGGIRVGLGEAILEGYSLRAREAAERDEARAEARGKAEGKAEEARSILRRALARFFPGLELSREIDEIRDPDVLESLLLDHAIRATDRDAVMRAITLAATAQEIEPSLGV